MEDLAVNTLRTFYNKRKVFVTGHTGFKGAWLIALLHKLGAETRGYALAPEHESDLYHVINGDAMCASTIADIRDMDRLALEIESFRPDLIVHMAAQSLVLRSYTTPVETYAVNVMGTAHLLECARQLGEQCDTIVITTDKVYENAEAGQLFLETDRLGGADPYSNSKACCELVVAAYRQSFLHPEQFGDHRKCIATARSGNVIGGGDWSEHRIIPDIINALRNDAPVQVRNPGSVRPWQFVLEPLIGYLLLGMKMREDPVGFSDAFNFGPSEQDMLTVEELVQRAIGLWGSGSIERANQTQPYEAGQLRLSSHKAQELIGWQSLLSADEAIRKTIDWYKDDDPKRITSDQIDSYLERL